MLNNNKGVDMSDGRITYYSSNELEEIINDLMIDANYSTKKAFYSNLLKGEVIDVRPKIKKLNNQSKLIQSNASQIKEINDYFKGEVGEVEDERDDLLDVNRDSDIDFMISDMHVLNSENTNFKDLGSLKYTENNKIGLTVRSPKYFDFYMHVLREALFFFDYEVATPVLSLIKKDDPYYTSIMDKIASLIDVKDSNKSYKQREIKQRFVDVSDKEIIDNKYKSFKHLDSDDISRVQGKNKEVNSILLNIIKSLDELKSNRKVVKKCKRDISLIIDDINNPKKRSKTYSDFIIYSLRNIKIRHYAYETSKEDIICKFMNNMDILNRYIAKYNECSTSDNKEKRNRSISVKLALRAVAINNYNLVKKFKTC